MKILKLSNGHLSAEFSDADWPQLANKLRRYGELQQKAVADVQLVVVGDARFVRMDEWDGAALIATNSTADRLLNRVARQVEPLPVRKRFVRSAGVSARPVTSIKVRSRQRVHARRDPAVIAD
jgi:hypothetical protein